MHENFRAQNYRKLKSRCQKTGQLFVDVVFPPTNVSLFFDEERSSNVEWKRPGDLVDNPRFFVEGANVTDVVQGILGNCWFVSACSALTHNESLLNKVIPDASEQEWSDKDEKRYAGIFRFCFWRFGRWLIVVVDDLLPTRDGKLLFARSKTDNEFWSALLEKAFAKLYGCYENLVGGQLADALQEVSGGVPCTIDLTRPKYADSVSKTRLFNQLHDKFDNKALIVAAIAPTSQDDIEKSLSCGLVKGHAYAITAVKYIDLDAKNRSSIFFAAVQRTMMVRLQNPWGEKEWNGPWSDGSDEWEQVTEVQKADLGIVVNEDGEFWMPWDEFCRYFTDISVCQLFNTNLFSFITFKNRYVETVFFDAWKAGRKSGAPDDRTGGCLNFGATFCSNPQYRFDVKGDEETTVMISLTQKEMFKGTKEREPYLTIGMHVMKVEDNRHYRLHQSFSPMATSDYANSRSVFLQLDELKPGRYIVVPTTYAPNEEGSFMLRIYTHTVPNAKWSLSNFRAVFSGFLKTRKLTKHKPPEGILECRCRNFVGITRLTVISAQGLFAEKEKSIDPFVIATSEKVSFHSRTLHNTTSPAWNWSVVFYRRNARLPIDLCIWDENKLNNTFLGRAIIAGQVDNDRQRLTVQLGDRNAQPTDDIRATVTIEIASYDDPVYL